MSLGQGVRLLELARRAHDLFRHRQPFDLLAVSTAAWEKEKATVRVDGERF
jgi:hypothetical protein